MALGSEQSLKTMYPEIIWDLASSNCSDWPRVCSRKECWTLFTRRMESASSREGTRSTVLPLWPKNENFNFGRSVLAQKIIFPWVYLQLRLSFPVRADWIRLGAGYIRCCSWCSRDSDSTVVIILDVCCNMAFKFSPLRLVSSFWLSGHWFLAKQFIWVFLSQHEVERTWPGKAQTIISYFPLIPTEKRRTPQKHVIGIQRARTNQRLKSVDLRHWLKIKVKTNRLHFKTRPPS